jgi:hypothetical protein
MKWKNELHELNSAIGALASHLGPVARLSQQILAAQETDAEDTLWK